MIAVAGGASSRSLPAATHALFVVPVGVGDFQRSFSTEAFFGHTINVTVTLLSYFLLLAKGEFMRASDREFFAKRELAELQMAALAASPSAGAVHLELAAMYRRQIKSPPPLKAVLKG